MVMFRKLLEALEKKVLDLWWDDAHHDSGWLSIHKKIKAMQNKNTTPPTIHEFLNNLYYDDQGQMIFSEDKEKGSHLVADIRGWGHLTGPGGLNLTDEVAAKFQDKVGRYIVEAIKFKLQWDIQMLNTMEPAPWPWKRNITDQEGGES